MGNPQDDRFTPADAILIKHKVRRLIGHYGIRSSDAEDLEQELALHVAKQSRRHDAKRGARSTFVDRMVRYKIAHLIGHRVAYKRDCRRERPLEEGAFQSVEDQSSDWRIDVQHAISLLPDDLRAVATLFMKLTEAEIIRETGVSRERVRGWRRRLAHRLTELGIGPGCMD